jgi:glycosyltransferase involved in cell wall biosynthesis
VGKRKSKTVLIIIPGSEAQGGISNYYQILKQEFKFPVKYFLRGSRTFPFKKGRIAESYRFTKDILIFFVLLITSKFSIIQTTTSFTPNSIVRDGIFILISKLFNKKVIVFFRGWDYSFADNIKGRKLKLFTKVFFKADAVIDLAKQNIERLRSWGYNGTCYLETTAVSKQLVKDISKTYVIEKFGEKPEKFNLLFLARVEIEKGIYETINAYSLVKHRFKNIQLIIAGDGLELENVRRYVKEKKIKDVVFRGFVKEDEKINTFKKSHLYILPSYREGMPGSVLEAMAFGLPVITRDVGGLPDFFKNGEHGFITNSKSPEIFAEYIEKIILNKELLQKISITNFEYAHANFLSDSVAKRMENIFTEVLNSKSNKN